MEDTKFKVGDRVRRITASPLVPKWKAGIEGTVTKIFPGGFELQEWPHDKLFHSSSRYKLVTPARKPKPPIFILQYELDTDPFELIYSEKELRKRIKELAENPDLKRDSIKVYDIKRIRTVELGVKITFKK